MSESVLERLVKTNPDMEIWWDSSPLVFEGWVKKMVDSAPPARKDELEAQLQRLLTPHQPTKSVFRACTTNPPLSLIAVKSNPDFWNRQIDEIIEAHPGIDSKQLSWRVYKEVIRRGAEVFLPIWEASNGRYGYVSGQLDPRLFTETEIMYHQADEISALAPNIMVKVPASKQGVEVVRYLTSKAIPTNVTTCFTLPQILAVARAAKEGVEIGKKNGVNMSKWRAVITHMIGRLTERSDLVEQGAYRGIEVTEADRKWFGLAVFKQAYRMLRDGGYPSKMLLCSVRPGPLVCGKMRYWDLEQLAGGDVVFTLPPSALEPLFAIGDDLHFRPGAIDEPVPQASLDKLKQIPYGIQSLDPNGLSREQFNTHAATLFTVAEFSKAANGLEEYCASRLELRTRVPTAIGKEAGV